jgi:hypothetical protein
MPVVGTYGTTSTFAATLTAAGAPVVGQAVTFSVTADGQSIPLGTVTTDATGTASLSGVKLATLPAGSYPGAVSAAFAGDPSDAPTTGSAGLTINQATPSVTWPMPADITQGQALGPAQLDAMASVLGTFTYTPAAGTLLPAGMGKSLTAVFTPVDTTDYKSVNVSTTLNVIATPTPTPTPTPTSTPTPTPTPAPAPQVTGTILVRKSKKRLAAITVSFNERLNPQSAINLGLYHVATGVKKHRKMVYSRAVPIANVTYNDSTRSVTLSLAKPSTARMQLTVGAGIVGANGASSQSAFTTFVK